MNEYSFNVNSCHQIIYTRKVIIMSFEIVSGVVNFLATHEN